MSPVKVLFMHGFTHNGTIMAKHMKPLVDACGSDVEIVFADGPLLLEAGKFIPIGNTTPDGTPPLAWYRANDDNTKYNGIDKGIERVKEYLIKEKFDGVMGFSQGATMTGIIAALLEKPHFYEPFLVNGEAPHPPLKFCVELSGVRAADTEWTKIFEGGYSTRTLHIYGSSDDIIPPVRTQTLIDMSKNNRVEFHEGGHIIPLNPAWCKFLVKFFLNPEGDVESPGSSLQGQP